MLVAGSDNLDVEVIVNKLELLAQLHEDTTTAVTPAADLARVNGATVLEASR